MNNYIVFSQPGCPFCVKAIDLLNREGINPIVVDIKEPIHRGTLTLFRHCGFTSVPQVFDDQNQLIGGFSELVDYFVAKKLVPDD